MGASHLFLFYLFEINVLAIGFGKDFFSGTGSFAYGLAAFGPSLFSVTSFEYAYYG